jgi:hypothetical protein
MKRSVYLLLLITILPLAAIADNKPGYLLQRIGHFPGKTQVWDKNSLGDTVYVDDEYPGGVSDENNRCALKISYTDNSIFTVFSWPDVDRSQFCEDSSAVFYLPSGNIFLLYLEAKDSAKISEFTSAGMLVYESLLSGVDSLYGNKFYYDTLRVNRYINFNANGTVAMSFRSKHNTRLFIYNEKSLRYYDYQGQYFLSKIMNWGEALLNSDDGRKDYSAIVNTTTGKIRKKFRMLINDFNRRGEEVFEGNVIHTRRGTYKLTDCSFPNSIRYRSVQLTQIDSQGKIYGTAETSDSQENVKVVLIRSKKGFTGAENFCVNIKSELAGTCSEFLVYSNVFFPGYQPNESISNVPETMACTVRLQVTDSKNRPLAGITTAVRDPDYPEKKAITQITDSQGRATLYFSFTPETNGVTAVAPFLDKKYRSSQIYIIDYLTSAV